LFEDSFYTASVALIESQAKAYRELKINEVAITAWAAEEKRKIELKLLREGGKGTFGQGFDEGLKDWGKDANNMFIQGEKMAKTTAASMSGSFSDLFFDVAKGEFKSFESYFKSFTDSILRTFSDMLAQMAAKWMMESIFGKEGAGGLFGTGGIFGATSIVGVDTGFAPGIDFGFMHSGGIVGASGGPSKILPAWTLAVAPRFHSGLRADEFPAILQKGEAVIPRNQVGSASGSGNASPTINNITIQAMDSKSFDDFVKRNQGSIMGVVNQNIKDRKVQDLWKPLMR